MSDKCPTCGSSVRVVSDGEGTNHYEAEAGATAAVPLDVERLTTILLNFGYDIPYDRARIIAAEYARLAAAGAALPAEGTE